MSTKNPYQSPSSFDSSDPSIPPAPDSRPLMIPGIILIILSAFMLATVPVSFLYSALNGTIPTEAPELMGYTFGFIAVFLSNLVILVGAISMVRKSTFGRAKVAAILACVPFCSPCYFLGIPFAIWALVILARPGVRETFRKS